MARAFGIAGYLVAIGLLSGAVWWAAWLGALDRLEERGRADLGQASGRLLGLLQQYRESVVLVAEHPALRALAEGRADPEAVSDLLRRMEGKTGARGLRLVSPNGWVLAQSSDGLGRPPPELMARALTGALGRHHGVEPDTGRRRFGHATPIFGDPGQGILAVLIIDVNVDALEANWRGAAEPVFFTDPDGLIFIANRSELVLQTAARDAPLGETPVTRSARAGHDVWRIADNRYLPRRALHLSQDLRVLDMTAELLVDLAPTRRSALLQALAAAGLGLLIGAGLLLASDRRRALAERLTLEGAVNAKLERDVADRTRALRDANRVLRAQIAERLDAEAALTRAQAELVQASRLSALGQMSAGISHELNQPLMAIRSFAENGQTFLERGKPDKAAENLGRIAEMARRMGRIIKNLRAFARQDSVEIRDVDLSAVIDDVLDMVDARTRKDGVRIVTDLPDGPVMVRGGEVRLSQVILNLVTNGMDAMAGQGGRLTITLRDGDPVRISIADEGPGLDAPDRIFDPFYSTKEVGASEGMGLGLSISYGLIQSFGGRISGRNADTGGAIFEIDLVPASVRAAA
ncbi:sensor histidine kinase [Maribius pontilimi]|uniref:C4-dicarboxylate transport sensor protein DctB n=1 Tax=Palleronia pontilimi TaxID=1964209 RepID=A0A934MBZ0_9RHOB|nr:ATP-binding protein [Palleronia pontilimi]MBJ3762213.1 sensor histidine kinase [Palleronia pontilimi]